jgi:titin
MKKILLYILFFLSSFSFAREAWALEDDSLTYNAHGLAENPELMLKVLREEGINAATPTLGVANPISSGSIQQLTLIALTNTKFVVAFRQSLTSTTITLRVGEITGSTITFGLLNNITGSFNNITLARLSDTEFALGYAPSSTEGFIRKGIVTATNSISLGTAMMFTDGNDDTENINQLRFVTLDANNIVALYSSIDLPGNFDILARVINLSIDPFTVSNTFDVTGAIDWQAENFDAVAISPTRIAVAYKDDVNGKIRFLDISGSAISFAGSPSIFYTGNSLTDIKLTLLNSSRLAVFYGDADFSNAIRGRLGDITGTSISGFSAAQTIASINLYSLSVTRLTNSRLGIAYVNSAQTQRGYVRILDALASSFDIGAEVEFINANAESISLTRASDAGFVISYENGFTANARLGTIIPPYTVTNLNDSGVGSLRWAIENSNTDPNLKTINFNVAGGGTILLATELPTLTTSVTIDGSTAASLVTLSGSLIDVSNDIGLNIDSDNVIVRGLRFINFNTGLQINGSNVSILDCFISNNSTGILIGAGALQAIIDGNFIGTNTSGTFAEANTSQGISVGGASEALIQNNLISGNGSAISVSGGSLNQITNNLIGTNNTGNTALLNQSGITLSNTQSCTVSGNTISGNVNIGLSIRAGSNTCTIENNKIGVGQDGIASLPNDVGIRIQNNAINNLIINNVITNSLSEGVIIEGTNTINNTLSQNGIFCNLGSEISLTNGGNGNKVAPVITQGSPVSISGTCSTCSNGETIEVFSDNGSSCSPLDTDPEARIYLGTASVVSGTWTLPLSAGNVSNGYKVTATATAITNATGNNNTSPLSNSFLICENINAPTSFATSNVTTTGFILNWNAVVGAIGYRLTIARNSNFTDVVSGFNNISIITTIQLITGLAPNTEYFISIKAENSCATSATPLTGVQFTLPPFPVATAASDVMGGSFKANWQAISGVNEYQVEVATDVTFSNIISQTSSSTNSLIINGLATSTTYHYRVFAVNPAGNSDASNTITLTTTLATPAPTALTVTVLSIIRIELNWEDNSNIETSYRVERRLGLTGPFTEIASLPANTTTFEDQGLNINVEYCYRVRAEVAMVGFSDYSNVSCAQTANVPNAPFNLNGAALNFNQILLNWEYNGTGALGFRLERSSPFTNGRFVEIAAIEISNRTFIDNDVIGNVSYRYRVRAFSNNGNSPFSNRATVTTPTDPSVGVPVPPFDVRAISVSPQQIDLIWEYTTDPNVIFKIERSVGLPNNFQPHVEFVSIEFISTKRYNDTINIVGNITYFYRIKACTSGGESQFSEIVSAASVCNLQVVVIRDDGGSEIICGGKTASMTINTRIFGASYQWRKNGQNILGAVFSNYFASETGQYSCEVTVGIGGACVAVSINELLVVVLGSPDNLQLTLTGGILQASVRDADTYEWYRDFVLIPDATEDSYIPTQSGAYYVIASIGPCASTSNLALIGITANEDTSLNPSLSLSPNPSTDYLQFKLEHPKNDQLKVTLIDMQGNRIPFIEETKNTLTWEKSLKVHHLPRGLYIVEVQLGELRGRKKIMLH